MFQSLANKAEQVREVLGTSSVRDLQEYLSKLLDTTQFFLRIVTCTVTILALLLIRIYLNTNNEFGASFSEAILFFFINLFAIAMVIYPWYLSVSNNFVYFKRLKKYAVLFGGITSVLTIVRSLLSPIAPFHAEDPNETSVAFRVMSTFYHIAFVLGFFLGLPLLVRKRQFLSSHGSPYSFSLFVFPFILLMFCGLVVQEWNGVSAVISYSPLILIAIYYINKVVNEIKGSGGLQFDEVFILAAGFVPIWLGSMLGKSLMEMSSRVGSVGVVVVVSAWRVLIFLFEVMTIEIGRKASRFNQESAFSFCVIYTGAIYAEFIFLSVKFNSFKFWALLTVEFLTIVLWQGGIMIHFQNWIVEYLNSEWLILQKIKLLWLIVIGEMPPAIAEKASQYKASLAPPDVKLSLIRSRAIVVQTTWSQNDIKMSSEFQSLICASTAVACDMIYSYFNIGTEFITLSLTGKRELLYIYLVNLIVLFIAQAIAKYELSGQVVVLKKDITEALSAVTSSYEQKMSQSIQLFRHDLKSSLETVTDKRINKEAKEFKQSQNIVKIASSAKRRMSALPFEASHRKGSTFAVGRNPLWSQGAPSSNAKPESMLSNSDTDYAAMESDHVDDLQDILEVTASLTAKIIHPSTPRASNRRASGFMQTSFFEESNSARHDTLLSDVAVSEWDDDIDFSSPANDLSDDSVANKAEGYIQKISGNGKFLRRFCVLTPSKMLMFYKKKGDVSDHVSSTSAHYNLNDATKILQSGDEIEISFESNAESLKLQAYTPEEGRMWINNLQFAVHETEGFYEEELFSPRTPLTFCRAMMGIEGCSSRIDSCDLLPLHKGYIARIVMLSYREHCYIKLMQPGVLYVYKNFNESNLSMKSGKILFSLTDILSVNQNESDLSLFEINVVDKTFKFEASSEGTASEWCRVFIEWAKYYAELTNASLQQTRHSLQSREADTYLPQHELEMVSKKSSSLNSINEIEYEEEKLGYLLVKDKSTLFKSGKWHRRWIQSDMDGVLRIFTKKMSEIGNEKYLMFTVNTSDILSVDICPRSVCCVLVHERGRHFELKTDSLADALSWRGHLLQKYLLRNLPMEKNFTIPSNSTLKSSPITPTLSDTSKDKIARRTVSSVLDGIILKIEAEVPPDDSCEIEPFSSFSSIFKPLGCGENPLEDYLQESSVKARRSVKDQDNIDFIDMILSPRSYSYVEEEVRDRIDSTSSIAPPEDNRNRSRSDVENIRFIKMNSKVDEDDFANKLKTQSYQDLNKEFWTRHKWYLTAVVCFVTLNVLSVTSYMIQETDF